MWPSAWSFLCLLYTSTLRDAPANMVAGKIHKEVRESEQDNVGVESAHKSEEAVETGARLVREGYHSHKLKPYRKAAQAERQLEKANVSALYQKSLQENPQFASNPLSRWQQKQTIKSSMQPLNTPVRLLGILPKLHRPPERPPGQ